MLAMETTAEQGIILDIRQVPAAPVAAGTVQAAVVAVAEAGEDMVAALAESVPPE